jgi:hypothetical protein
MPRIHHLCVVRESEHVVMFFDYAKKKISASIDRTLDIVAIELSLEN